MLLGFNEVGLDVAEFFRARKRDVFCIDLDPQLHKTFRSAYKGTCEKKASHLPASMKLKGLNETMSPPPSVAFSSNMAPGMFLQAPPRTKSFVHNVPYSTPPAQVLAAAAAAAASSSSSSSSSLSSSSSSSSSSSR